MMINTAGDVLADHCSNHIRIRTAILENKMDRAHDLLLTRMRGTLQGFTEGDLFDEDEVIDALATLASCWGPITLNALTEAAQRECIRIAHS